MLTETLIDRYLQYALQRFNQFTASLQTKGAPPPPGGKYLPFRVVVYRDGVSEGEYQAVFRHEIGEMKSKYVN